MSKSQEFRIALAEWKFTGGVVDHEEPVEQCELCEHEELRYHYEIENIYNEQSLWVGSSCILRFQEINVFDDCGNLLTDEYERKKLLEKALREKLIDLMLQPLRELWRKDRQYSNFIERNVRYFKSKNAFLPKNIAILFAKLNSFGIQYKPGMFPVYLRTQESREQLHGIESDLFPLIVEALSPAQRSRFATLIKSRT